MTHLLLLLLACADKPSPETGPAETAPHTDETDTARADSADSAAETADTGEPIDSSSWACGDDGLQDATTLCYDHDLYSCDVAAVGLRRGDWLCWPAHAFCPEPGVYCTDTTEGWTTLPLAYPSDFRAVAEGVLNDPELVFVSPIDGDFVPTRSVLVDSISEAYNAFYYDEVVAGEEVVLADGTYSDCYIGMEGNGEPGKPLVLRAETPGGVTLESCSIYMGGSYLVLSGFRFTGKMIYTPIAMGYTGLPCEGCAVREVTIDTVLPDAPTNRPYVQIYGRGNEVSDSSFIGKANTSAVITVDRPDPSAPLEARIYRNTFSDRTNTVADEGVTNGFEVIRAGYSMDYFSPGYVIIEGNLFERCDGELETISLKSGHNAVRFNTFRDNAGQISVRDGFGNIVEGNYLLGEDKDWSGGVRASGANTIIANNHIQDIVPYGSRWRYPLSLTTGSDDPYTKFTTTFESAVLFNRVLSAQYGFALDTGEDYPPTFYPPHDNLYAYNVLFTGGSADTLGYTFEASLSGNTIRGNELDSAIDLEGFALSEHSSSTTASLARVPGFDASITVETVTERLDGVTLELAQRGLVLDGTRLYDQVPLLSAGDVGGP